MQLSEEVRTAALELFLERGYEGTTLEAIAHAAGTTKASLYGRYEDKETLFRNVVRWAISRPDWPTPEPPVPDDGDLEASLGAIADAALRRATHPDMVKLTRIAVAQASRFPDLAEQASTAGWPRKQLVVELLQRHAATGAILAKDPDILAEHFLGLVSGMPARLASFGIVRRPEVQRRYTDAALKLFLGGVRPPAATNVAV
jgi:AcrR family transcriptional regulator